MDITNANSVVSLMNSVLAPSSKVGSAGDSAKVSIDFGAVLKSSLDKVDASQQKAETLSRSFELGNNDVDLHDVMLSLQKANIDLQTAVQVRNKLVSAYQNIMSMSI
ncbi:flagellar hook-basal body complex protein FliE [Ralstonia solanacearum]|uniref:flagellar hook-basal body complex protein FliE n=1 Tax=Ralstonia solanacearum TaxID=305 RepID=UPI001FF838F1